MAAPQRNTMSETEAQPPPPPRARRSSIPAAAAAMTVVTLAASGCASLPFPGKPKAEPTPRPAALPEDTRLDVPELPLALTQDEDYVVRVVAGSVTCSGTLIEEDRVLTAHHCVTERNQYGDPVARDFDASEVRVELGGDYLPWGEVGVRAIVAPSCGYAAGEGDIAILVLERRLIGVATLTPRLDRGLAKGEHVQPIGFGRCALSSDGVRRKRRIGGDIDAVGTGRFQLQAGICLGDSGGPGLVRETGELVGMISAAVMDSNEKTVGRSEFTRLDRWRSVFSNAKLIAEGASPNELPPLDCTEP